MKSTALVPQPKFGSAASASLFALALLIISWIGMVHAQNEPILVPDAVDYQKLLPILPDPPQGWVADKAEGSTEDVGGFRITNVHRDYHKGEGEQGPDSGDQHTRFRSEPGLRECHDRCLEQQQRNQRRLRQICHHRSQPWFRSLRKRKQACYSLGHDRQSLFRSNRAAEPGSQGIAGMGQTRRFKEASND